MKEIYSLPYQKSDVEGSGTLGTYYLGKYCSRIAFDDFSLNDPVAPTWKDQMQERIPAWHESVHAMQDCGSGFGVLHALESYKRDISILILFRALIDEGYRISIPLRKMASKFSKPSEKEKFDYITNLYDSQTKFANVSFQCKDYDPISFIEVIEGATGLFDVLSERYYLMMNGVQCGEKKKLYELTEIVNQLELLPVDYNRAFFYFLFKLEEKTMSIDPVQICSLFFLAVDLALNIPPYSVNNEAECRSNRRFVLIVDKLVEAIDLIPIIPQNDFMPMYQTLSNGLIQSFKYHEANIKIIDSQIEWTRTGYKQDKLFVDINATPLLKQINLLLEKAGFLNLKQQTFEWQKYIQETESFLRKSRSYYPMLDSIKRYQLARVHSPQLFWGFSNIRSTAIIFGNPFVCSLNGPRCGVKTRMSGEYIMEQQKRKIEAEKSAVLNNEMVMNIAAITQLMHDIVNNDKLNCPFCGANRINRCPNENKNCDEGILSKSKHNEPCFAVKLFTAYFRKLPNEIIFTDAE